MGQWTVLGMDLHGVRYIYILIAILIIILFSGRKFGPESNNPSAQEYGGFSKINDTVGILLEFKD
jgi:hypothetical protein